MELLEQFGFNDFGELFMLEDCMVGKGVTEGNNKLGGILMIGNLVVLRDDSVGRQKVEIMVHKNNERM